MTTQKNDHHVYALGWQLSDAVRCDPHYRNAITGGGFKGPDGRFQGRGDGGKKIKRLRWTTTLQPEAMEILREMALKFHLDRNEIVEQLLFAVNYEAKAKTINGVQS